MLIQFLTFIPLGSLKKKHQMISFWPPSLEEVDLETTQSLVTFIRRLIKAQQVRAHKKQLKFNFSIRPLT